MPRARIRFRGRGEGAGRAWELPISMIDVVFLLLVFFLLASRFRQQEGVLRADMSSGGSGPPPDIESVLLKVDAETASRERPVFTVRSHVFRSPDAGERLVAHLVGLARIDSRVPVVIRGGGDVPFWMVVAAVDACGAARLEKVRFEAPPRTRPAPARPS